MMNVLCKYLPYFDADFDLLIFCLALTIWIYKFWHPFVWANVSSSFRLTDWINSWNLWYFFNVWTRSLSRCYFQSKSHNYHFYESGFDCKFLVEISQKRIYSYPRSKFLCTSFSYTPQFRWLHQFHHIHWGEHRDSGVKNVCQNCNPTEQITSNPLLC